MNAASSPVKPTSARRTAALAFTFAGRATRTEVASYVLAVLLVSVPISFLAGLLFTYEFRLLVSNALALLLAIPVPAVLVRRLHDQGRSGKLAWLAAFAFAVWAVRTVTSMTLGVEARIGLDRATWVIDWLVIMANLASVLLTILPGTPGPNRFGPDPRGRDHIDT